MQTIHVAVSTCFSMSPPLLLPPFKNSILPCGVLNQTILNLNKFIYNKTYVCHCRQILLNSTLDICVVYLFRIINIDIVFIIKSVKYKANLE